MKNNIKLSDALWSDCETDEERSDFLQSGRGWSTGIIAKSIQNEVAAAFQFRSETMKEKFNCKICEDITNTEIFKYCPNCGRRII